MIEDIRTIFWKEMKCLMRGKNRSRIIAMLISPMFFSILLPIQSGEYFLKESIVVFITTLMAIMYASVITPSAFTGEKEQKTLETLFASRLSEKSILWGKFLTSLLFSIIMSLGIALISIITYNIAFWNGSIQFYNLPISIGILCLSFLGAVFATSIGLMISFKAETAQQASQTLATMFMVPPSLLSVVLFILPNEIRDRIISFDGKILLTIIISVFIALDIIVLYLAVKKFRRTDIVLSQ